MTHVCDDTAYPAAAMPDECTCGGEPMYTDADGNAIRPFRSAAYNERNTPMTDPTAAERIGDYMAGRAETVVALYDVIEKERTTDEDGYTLTEAEAYDRLAELPLSVEVIRHVKVLLGTGGPADWLDAELDSEGDIRVLEYHYADWGDHAQVNVPEGHILWRYAESFVELAADA